MLLLEVDLFVATKQLSFDDTTQFDKELKIYMTYLDVTEIKQNLCKKFNLRKQELEVSNWKFAFYVKFFENKGYPKSDEILLKLLE